MEAINFEEFVILGGDCCSTAFEFLPSVAIVAIVVCSFLLLLTLLISFKLCGKKVINPANGGGRGEDETVASGSSSGSEDERANDESSQQSPGQSSAIHPVSVDTEMLFLRTCDVLDLR